MPIAADTVDLAEYRAYVAQRDEIARLKGVPGRPMLRPSGMEKATQPKSTGSKGKRGRGGKKTARRIIHEDRVVKVTAPAGSRFKAYEDFVVQDKGPASRPTRTIVTPRPRRKATSASGSLVTLASRMTLPICIQHAEAAQLQRSGAR